MLNFHLYFNELCLSRGLNAAARTPYLAGLQNTARLLRNSYQNDNIVVDYGHMDIQFVYLTRYFPFYTQIVRAELNAILQRNIPLPAVMESNPLNVSLFCCGPAPEAYSICRFLAEHGIVNNTINFNVLDIHAQSWRNSRNVVMNHVAAQLLPQAIINVNEIAFDLRLPISAQQLASVIPSNLVVFQNCLNEINDSGRAVVKQTILQIVAGMAPESILVIIERSGYNPVLAFLNNLSLDLSNNNCEILTYGLAQPKNINNTGLRAAILNTECNSAYKIFEAPMTGLVLSPNVDYWSLVVRKRNWVPVPAQPPV